MTFQERELPYDYNTLSLHNKIMMIYANGRIDTLLHVRDTLLKCKERLNKHLEYNKYSEFENDNLDYINKELESLEDELYDAFSNKNDIEYKIINEV